MHLVYEIFENCTKIMHGMYEFNRKRLSHTNSLSGFRERNEWKVIIALSTNENSVELFEKKLIEGFSCVNTRVAFDSKILFSSFPFRDYSRLNLDESFKMKKRTNLKVGHRLQPNNESNYNDRKIISKILKWMKVTIMVKQWQYLTWKHFNIISVEDKIDHLFLCWCGFDE